MTTPFEDLSRMHNIRTHLPREVVLSVVERFSTEQQVKIGVFGSYAKGTQTPFSDIDLLLFEGSEFIRENRKLHKSIVDWFEQIFHKTISLNYSFTIKKVILKDIQSHLIIFDSYPKRH